jgi:hypothetical protein
LVDVVVIHVLIYQQPLVFTKAAPFQIHKVFMLHSSDTDNFVQKVVYTLSVRHKQLLHSHRTLIWQYSLQQEVNVSMPLGEFPWLLRHVVMTKGTVELSQQAELEH